VYLRSGWSPPPALALAEGRDTLLGMRLTKDGVDDPWLMCVTPDCIGARVAHSDYCVVHSVPEIRVASLAEIKRGETCTWTRGIEIDEDLMNQIRDAASVGEDDFRTLPAMDFTSAKFRGIADFSRCVFTGYVTFHLCEFDGGAEFGAARFQKGCAFSSAEIHGRAFFKAVTIAGRGYFIDLQCRGLGTFSILSAGELDFTRACFGALATFGGSCSGRASFEACKFSGGAVFNGFSVGSCSLLGATFSGGPASGTLMAEGGIDLTDARLVTDFTVKLQAAVVGARGLRAEAAVQLEVSGYLDLQGARFEATTLITSIAPHAWTDLGIPKSAHPVAQILSLRLADVRQVTLGEVDLSVCRFDGAHGLDVMKIESTAIWGRAPRVCSRPRQVIADEVLWHTRAGDTPRWSTIAASARRAYGLLPHHFGSEGVDPDAFGWRVPRAADVAGVYRALRKHREEDKDAPGATDFYFGEMEMRRRAVSGRSAERWLLLGYWLVSGYALKAWRAVVSLALLLAVAAVLMTACGFDKSFQSGKPKRVELHTGRIVYAIEHPDYGIGDGLVYSIRTATSLMRAPEGEQLTPVGHVVEVVLRLLGPFLLALAVLALRGRMKR
jgi:uncharacterized protein YjbI with pentapeptide repeats